MEPDWTDEVTGGEAETETKRLILLGLKFCLQADEAERGVRAAFNDRLNDALKLTQPAYENPR